MAGHTTKPSWTTPEAYINGSDAVLLVDDLAVGHCTSHTVDVKNDTKERLVKPSASNQNPMHNWKHKSVTCTSVTVSGDGLICLGEADSGYDKLLQLMTSGVPVELAGFRRGEAKADNRIDMYGWFIITSLTKTSPAGEDETYSFTAENTGRVLFGDTANRSYYLAHKTSTLISPLGSPTESESLNENV